VTAMLDQTPSLRFDIEETIVSGDRVITCWRYDFGTGHVRGVDVNRVRDGLIAETRAYVKG
jgi:predicted ester cyclase